jgi:hypothetical protein
MRVSRECAALPRKMARLGRLERPTLCFGGTRSIQLSYRRAVDFNSIGEAVATPSASYSFQGLALSMLPDLLGQFFDLFGFLQHRNG